MKAHEMYVLIISAILLIIGYHAFYVLPKLKPTREIYLLMPSDSSCGELWLKTGDEIPVINIDEP